MKHSEAGDELRATVCTRVIAMLTPADAEAVAEAMAAQPRTERTLVRQDKIPLSVCVGLVVVGSVLMLLLLHILSPDFDDPPPCTPRDKTGTLEEEEEDAEGSEDDDME